MRPEGQQLSLPAGAGDVGSPCEQGTGTITDPPGFVPGAGAHAPAVASPENVTLLIVNLSVESNVMGEVTAEPGAPVQLPV